MSNASFLHSECIANGEMAQSGQQVILLEGMEVMPPVPQELKDMPHVEFDMPAHYGPMD